jgi:hypothetical protein
MIPAISISRWSLPVILQMDKTANQIRKMQAQPGLQEGCGSSRSNEKETETEPGFLFYSVLWG